MCTSSLSIECLVSWYKNHIINEKQQLYMNMYLVYYKSRQYYNIFAKFILQVL